MTKREPTKPNKPGDTTGKKRRKILRGVIFCLLIVVTITLAAGVLILQTRTVKERIKAYVEETAQKKLDGTLEIGALSGNLLSHVCLKNVILARDGNVILSAEEICADYLIPLLLGKLLYIQDFRIKGFFANLVKESTGTWNLVTLIKEVDKTPGRTTPPSSFQIAMAHVHITDGKITVTDRQENQSRQFKDVEILAGVELGSRITAEIMRGSFLLDRPHFALRSLQGDISYAPKTRRLEMPQMRVETGNSELALTGRVTFSEQGPQVDLVSRFDRLKLQEILQWIATEGVPPSLVESTVTGRLEVKGTGKDFSHLLEMDMDQLSVESRGRVDLTTSTGVALDISTSIHHLNPAALPFPALKNAYGDVGAKINIKGRNLAGADRRGIASIVLTPSHFLGYELEEAKITTHFNGADVKITEGSLVGPLGRLDMEGALVGILDGDSDTVATLFLALDSFSPEKQNVLPGLRGRADIEVRAEAVIPPSMEWEKLTAQTMLKITSSDPDVPFDILGVKLKKGHASAGWDKGRLTIDNLDVTALQGRLAMKGSVVPKKKTCDIKLDIELPSLEPAVATAGQYGIMWPRDLGLAGRASLTNRIEGDWSNDRSNARIVTTMDVDDLKLEKATIKGLSLASTARIYRDKKGVEGGGKRDPLQQWKKWGFDIAATASMEGIGINGHSFPTLRFHVEATPDQARVDLNVTHESKSRLFLAGKIDPWQASSKNITINRFNLAVPDMPDMPDMMITNEGPIRLTVSKSEMTLSSLNVRSGQEALAIEGRLDLDGDIATNRHRLKASLSNLDLERFARFWPDKPRISGIASADLSMEGTFSQPFIETDISLSQCEVYDCPFPQASLTASYGNEKVQAQATIYTDDQKSLGLSGTLQATLALQPFSFVVQKEGLDATLETNDLSLSQLPMPTGKGVTYGGRVDLWLQMTGDPTTPTMRGHLRLKDGHLNLSKPPLAYRDVQGSVRITPDQFIVERIEIKDNRGGSLALSGTLGHQGLRPNAFNVSLTGKDCYVPFHRAIYARVWPDLILSGTMDAATLKGELEVHEGTADIDLLFQDQPSEIQIVSDQQQEAGVITVTKTKPERSVFMNGLTTDVDLRVPRNFWIKGRKKNIEVSGSVNLKKAPRESFIFLGSVNTVRGTYEFQNKLFKISRGRATFLGLEEPNPNLDIEALTRIKDVDIILRIGGTAKRPELTLDSSPPMQEADIISYLVFGKPTDSATTQQAFKAEETALNISGKLAAGKLEEILAETFRLDVLSIEPGMEELTKGTVSLGKYVTPRVFVVYEHPFEEGESPELDISYEINRNFEIETQVGNERTTGVDLIWEHDF